MKDSERELLKLIFHNPMAKFHVRALARSTKLDTKTVMKYIKQFVKRKLLVRRKERGGFPYYEPDRSSQMYTYEKSQFVIAQIYQSKIIEYLERELRPQAIVLFGSIRNGTYHPQSDIDLFIQGDRKSISLHTYEKVLGKSIQLLFEKFPEKLSKGLLTNIYNGYVVSGKLRI